MSLVRNIRPWLLASLSLFAGCALVDGRRDFGPTLADLPPAVMPPVADPVPVATLDQIEESYRAALTVAKAPGLRHRILVRLADIEMARSENRQLSASEEREHFADAISMYDELLVLSETRADTATDERLLYRLSKAYALDGRMAESNAALARLEQLHPESAFVAEADFRRAEQAFSNGHYVEAEDLYQKVVNAGDTTPFYLNAVYMLGWSQFKASEFRRSVYTFTEVLDRLMPEGQDVEGLTSAQQGLRDDTLRVMGITFTYLDGAQAITDIYQEIGERHYQYLIYQQLGNLYLDKKLHTNAAETYSHFINQFPMSVHGPDFATYRMEVFKAGGFASEVLPAKEDFVRQYGIHSAYWSNVTEEHHVKILPHLDSFLDELSSYYHAEGQALVTAAQSYDKLVRTGKKPKKRPEEPQASFLKAAAYYAEYLATFPASPRQAEMTFLLAEAYFEADELASAVQAYERVAYDILDAERGATAGYAAILALTTLTERAQQVETQTQQAEARIALQNHKIRSAISFADYYPADPRAVAVLTNAAQEVFSSGDPLQAVEIARRITAWQPPPEAALRQTAWLIVAHSEFDGGDFIHAEQSYRQVLNLMPVTDSGRPQVIERIAASMYKAAEQKVAAGDVPGAIEQLLQIEAAAPGSELAIRAQYDAGNYLLELQDWSRAENVFVDFQRRFASHALATTLAPKMALIFQETQQWDRAAGVLAQMSQSDKDPATRRQSLYLSAELYQKSGNASEAAKRYADYVKAYPEPFDLATEARYQALQIALEANNRGDRNYWLTQLIKADANAGNRRTDRSRYLAAYATNQFAGESFAKFERIKLTLPIKKSLNAKKSALDETLKAYKKVIDYGVAEFMTEANYRIGNVYSQLSRDLMNSERPNGLDELAMEQYEILLEEQAYPFEEKSVQLLETNASRAWDGFYDDWVKRSFKELATILPARYGKKEQQKEVSDGLR